MSTTMLSTCSLGFNPVGYPGDILFVKIVGVAHCTSLAYRPDGMMQANLVDMEGRCMASACLCTPTWTMCWC